MVEELNTREIVVQYVKAHSPEKLRDKRIARDLKMSLKVVRSCLHTHARIFDSNMRLSFQSPINRTHKRPLWSYPLPAAQGTTTARNLTITID
jgi:hypothetical protein